jgi:hypothetical protein
MNEQDLAKRFAAWAEKYPIEAFRLDINFLPNWKKFGLMGAVRISEARIPPPGYQEAHP